MEIFYGIIFGLMEGLGIFLPFSRESARLFAQQLLPAEIAGNEGLSMLIGVCALIGGMAAFYKVVGGLLSGFFHMVRGAFQGTFRWRKAGKYQIMALYALLAAVPPLVIAAVRRSYDFAAGLQGNYFIAFMLLANGGLLYIGTHSICKKWEMRDMKPGHALKLGLFQGAAVLPGLSRPGVTLAMGMNMGFTPDTALEFAFAAGVPAMITEQLFQLPGSAAFSGLHPGMVAGALCAAALGAFSAAKLMQCLVKRAKLNWMIPFCLLLGVAACFAA